MPRRAFAHPDELGPKHWDGYGLKSATAPLVVAFTDDHVRGPGCAAITEAAPPRRFCICQCPGLTDRVQPIYIDDLALAAIDCITEPANEIIDAYSAVIRAPQGRVMVIAAAASRGVGNSPRQ